MEQDMPHGLSKYLKYWLVLLAFAGAALVYLPMTRHGAGLSPDSVGYIGTARNLARGLGFTNYDNTPMVTWAPLYPALLAFLGAVLSADPLVLGGITNALIFGLIVYSSGILAFRLFREQPWLAWLAVLAVLLSNELFVVTVMVWTEPLFILFVLLSLLSADTFLHDGSRKSLIVFSGCVGLALLVRYVGVVLVLWGGLIILLFRQDSFRAKIRQVFIFILISVTPFVVWLVRNRMVSGTFLGERASSMFTFPQNIAYAAKTIFYWYFPEPVSSHQVLLAGLILFAGMLVGAGAHQIMRMPSKEVRRHAALLASLAVAYLVFLIVSASVTAYDKIGYRLLAPVYVPITLLLFLVVRAAAGMFQRRWGDKTVGLLTAIGIAVWLLYPLAHTIHSAGYMVKNGRGYHAAGWGNSSTLAFLGQNPDSVSGCVLYTNDPEALYILAGRGSKLSPMKTRYHSAERLDLSHLAGNWPAEKNACLVWFDHVDRSSYLLTLDELDDYAVLTLVRRFDDGSIFRISKKQPH